MATCSNCNADVSPRATTCPFCGEPNPTRYSMDNPVVAGVLLVIALVAAAVVFVAPAYVYNHFSGRKAPWQQAHKSAQFWWVTGGFWITQIVITQAIAFVFSAADSQAAGSVGPFVYFALGGLLAFKARDIRKQLDARGI